MDDHTRDLIVSLCTKAGIVMEDASAPAIWCAGHDGPSLGLLVTMLTTKLEMASALVAAATKLLEYDATLEDQRR